MPAVAALRARFDVPISVDTFRARVAREAFAAGAQIGNDISGFADPDYLPAAAAHQASVAAEAKSFQVPSNRSTPVPPQAPKLSEIKLITFDFAKYGSSAERKRLLERWDREVGSQAR